MTATEKFNKWIEKRRLKKRLAKRGLDINGQFYVVSDYGYEDCGYDGPFSFNGAVNKWKQLTGHNVSDCHFFDGTFSHYITQDTWKLESIQRRRRASW